MSATDSPDWQNVVTVSTGGPVTDAPDWQEIVVGPGGAPVTVATTSNDFPPDQGYYGWSGPPYEFPIQDSALSNAELDLVFAKAVVSGTVNNLTLYMTGVGSGFVANKNYMGIYIPVLVGGVPVSLSLLATTAAGVLEGIITTSGIRTIPLSSSLAVTAGQIYYIALTYDQTSGQVPLAVRNTQFLAFPGQNYAYRYSGPVGPFSSLPSSVTLSSEVRSTDSWWAAFGP